MKAKKKKIETFKPEDLGLDFVRFFLVPSYMSSWDSGNQANNQNPRLETISVTDPPKRQGGGKVESVDELVSKMKEAGVI
jgi:electron transfer flavoprotein beta subunit